jgi:glycosyltransferase involved in cell wall biosynthesis
METVTLLSVNWNQQPAMELMLRSYAKHHYAGTPLNLMLVDNGSTDGSKEWLRTNNIPFLDIAQHAFPPYANVGHERAINFAYNKVKTPYTLLADSDIEFQANVRTYLPLLFGMCNSVGELREKDYYGVHELKPRILPWFWLFDSQRMKANGVTAFRGEGSTDWTYDVGAWYWEKMKGLGFTNHNLTHVVSPHGWWQYDKFIHYGQISTAPEYLPGTDVVARRKHIVNHVKTYQDVFLENVFDGNYEYWSTEILNQQMVKGWAPI